MTQNEYRQKWEQCREYIKQNLDEHRYKTWFEPLSFYSFNSQTNELKINSPSSFFNEYISTHFAALTYRAIREQFGHDVRLFFRQLTDSENHITQVVESINTTPLAQATVPDAFPSGKTAASQPAAANAVPEKSAPAPQLDSHLIADYSFDNFIEGASNKLSRSVGVSIAQNPKQMTFNPLFIFGHSGVGKTHLVNAIGRAIKELHPEKRVLYLSAHLFHVQYVDSVRKNTVNDFIHFYQQIDVLILDDIQEFATLTKTQNTFFHIFNHLKSNGKQLILTSDRAPVDMQGMEERLLTRFKWGLLAEMEQPDEKLRRGILVSKIHRNGLHIPADVVDYISKNVTDSVRDLEGVITSLMAHSVVYNCEIDIDLARRVIGRATKLDNKPITIDDIIEQVCEACAVSKDDLFSQSRKANVVQARQIAMFLAQKYTDLSVAKIGALIGKRNHTTVLHSVRLITDHLDTDKKLKAKVEEIEAKLKMNR